MSQPQSSIAKHLIIRNIKNLTSLLFALIMSGCPPPPQPNVYTYRKANDQEELGPAQVAVVSVSRFEDVQTDLQPKFDLSSSSALDGVAPTTQFATEQMLQVLAAKLGIGLPTSSATE